MEQILAFITPCQPLTERCKFSIRVFTSWISSGLVLGLVLGLFSLGSKTSNPSGLFFNILFTIPAAICILGFIGLGIGSSRGDENYHAGWYWYFFPIVTYLVIGFWVAFAFIALTFALAGVRLPKPNFTSSNSPNSPKKKRKRRPVKVASQYKDKINKKKEEFVRRKAEILSEYSDEKELEKHPDIRDLVETLSFREFVINKVNSLLEAGISLEDILDSEDLLTEEEYEEYLSTLEESGLIIG